MKKNNLIHIADLNTDKTVIDNAISCGVKIAVPEIANKVVVWQCYNFTQKQANRFKTLLLTIDVAVDEIARCLNG